MQLHLYNASAAPITTSTRIQMHQTATEDPTPVGMFAFGTTEVELPPQSLSTVSNDYTVSEDIVVAAMLPHMH